MQEEGDKEVGTIYVLYAASTLVATIVIIKHRDECFMYFGIIFLLKGKAVTRTVLLMKASRLGS